MTTTRDAAGPPGLGLGWLLAIGLGGGVLLVATVGLLVAWFVKRRPRASELTVYSSAVASQQSSRRASARSAKRGLLKSESSFSRLSSKLSMTMPPVLPPLPTYNSFNMSDGRRKKRSPSWIDEEALHGPAVRRLSLRDSWLFRDGWLGASPTLPNLVESAPEKLTNAPSENQTIEVQKRQQSTSLSDGRPESDSATALVEASRGRQRIPPLMPIKLCGTESDLKDILASTEQRLRDGGSVSPEERIGTSSSRAGSPTKTPRSVRTVLSSQSNGRLTPCPSKRNSYGSTAVRTHSRTASIISIGSITNSLIRQATAELELPGGRASPSRLRVEQWQPPSPKQKQKQSIPVPQSQPQTRPEPPIQDHPAWKHRVEETRGQDSRPKEEEYLRRVSTESDVSSALSTLYSVEEPDEETHRAAVDNPFTAKGPSQARPQPTGPRPLRRPETMPGIRSVDQSAIPAPLRTVSVNARTPHRPRADAEPKTPLSLGSPSWLSPPPKSDRRSLKAAYPTSEAAPETRPGYFLPSPESSESSLISCSVHTAEINSSEDDDDDRTVTPRPGSYVRTPEYRSDTSSPEAYATPSRKTGELGHSQLDSCPTSVPAKRELPDPALCAASRTHGNGIVQASNTLSRPETSLGQYPPPFPSWRESVSSSNYDAEPGANNVDEDQHMDLPTPIRGQAVGSTIAELRRTNSVVSSFSATSLASTLISDTHASSARGAASKPKAAVSGTRNYLNLGGLSALRRKKADQSQDQAQEQEQEQVQVQVQAQTQQRPPPSLVVKSRSAITNWDSGKGRTEANKENHVVRSRTVRFETVEHPRQGGIGSSSTGTIALRGSADNRSRWQRHSNQSMESTGLYDKDGFLMSSPVSEKNTKGGRWRM